MILRTLFFTVDALLSVNPLSCTDPHISFLDLKGSTNPRLGTTALEEMIQRGIWSSSKGYNVKSNMVQSDRYFKPLFLQVLILGIEKKLARLFIILTLPAPGLELLASMPCLIQILYYIIKLMVEVEDIKSGKINKQ